MIDLLNEVLRRAVFGARRCSQRSQRGHKKYCTKNRFPHFLTPTNTVIIGT
jgi:hypothetical protein